ncbi:hypothetical protein Droror1_Dr00019445 [Drosera rotundifolia]
MVGFGFGVHGVTRVSAEVGTASCSLAETHQLVSYCWKSVPEITLGCWSLKLRTERCFECLTTTSSVVGVVGGEQTSRHRVGCFVQDGSDEEIGAVTAAKRLKQQRGVEGEEEFEAATMSRGRRGVKGFHLVEKLKCTKMSSRWFITKETDCETLLCSNNIL